MDASPLLSLAALVLSGAVLIVAGVRLTALVDQLADRLRIGEALAGGVLLGMATSLSGLIVTTLAAARGEADLAVSNALGGIAAQTAFIAIADLTYRRGNLEHAAASLPNVLQSLLLAALASLVLLAMSGPDWALWGIHPITPLLPAVYLYGLVLIRRARDVPMWLPQRTPQTCLDTPDPRAQQLSLARLGLHTAAAIAVVSACGGVITWAGLALTAQTALSGTIVGGLITSVITSLPELVTVLAAVRAGALTLAVGDIIGGNSFDVLFLFAADLAYGEGSIYAAVGDRTEFLLALTLLLTAVLAAGLVSRERRGIGFEGVTILAIYVVGFAVLGQMP